MPDGQANHHNVPENSLAMVCSAKFAPFHVSAIIT